MLVVILFALSTLVALGNVLGVAGALRRPGRSGPRGFSSVPLLSLMLALAAWGIGPEPLGAWVLLPTMLDPGTWSVLLLPWYALTARDEAPPPEAPERTRRLP